MMASLVGGVLAQAPASGAIVDLYAGVGLFALALAATGREPITAVEGDHTSINDLSENAKPFGDAVRAVHMSVEGFLRSTPPAPGAVIVDPPRTGVSREALERLLAWSPPHLVYVSCDVATLARDIRQAVDAGYSLTHIEAFDLFPNTAHVETLAVLARRSE
jgi:23S rRNA (uracil1939-C5)-methyltransferase